MMDRISLRWSMPLAILVLMMLPLALLSHAHYRIDRDALQTRYLGQAEIAIGGLKRLIEAGQLEGPEALVSQALASVEAFPCFSRAFGVDADQRVILASNEAWIGRPLAEIDARLAAHWPTAGASLVRLDAEGNRVVAWHPFRSSLSGSSTGNWLFLELDLQKELSKQREAMLEQTLTAGLVVLLFSLILWRWIERSLAHPLRALTAAAGQVAAGQDIEPLPARGWGEMTTLTRAFNTMAVELTRRYTALTHQRMLYQTLSDTNQAILRGDEEQSLLARICEVAVQAGIKLVWIGYVDKRADSLKVVQSAGAEAAWLETVRRYVGFESDPLAQAVKRGEETVVPIASAAHPDSHWYAEAQLAGFAAGAALPIQRGGSWVGGLVVMSQDAGLFDGQGMSLLREIAADLGFALDSIDREVLRRRVEQSLAGDRALLRTLIDSIPDVIFFKDRVQTYLGCNKAFERLIAMHEEKLVGGTDQDIFTEQLARLFRHQDSEILLSGSAGRSEAWMEYPDGRKVLLDIVKTPYRGADGKITGLIGVGRDITAEFHARESLKKTLQILENAEKISHLGSWTQDQLTGRMHWSDVVYQILGYEPHTVEPAFEKFLDRCHADERQEMESIAQALRDGKLSEFMYEHRIVTPQGETRHVIERGCVRGEGSDIIVMGTLQDVSQCKREEAERERTLEAMRQAQKLEAIGELTGGVVHGLNNILVPILGFSELAMQDGDLPRDKLRTYLENINESALRGRDLIARLTAISHGDATHDAQVQDLAPLVEEFVRLMRAALPSGIAIDTHFVHGLPKVLIDPVHFKEILMSLCINARDALGEKGGIAISLAFEPALETTCSACGEALKGDYVTLCVADDGPGISAERVRQLFDSFYTTKGSEKQRSGMGLAVVQGLLHSYLGHVVVVSEPGEGSRFRLLFRPAAEQTSSLSSAPASAGEGSPRIRSGQRVMLVDDEPAIILFMTEFLEMQGLSVEAFTDSEQALARFRQSPAAFDLLITDQAMPMINGLELVEQVHALRSDLPVILCTGYSERVSGANAVGFGVDRFLEKPVLPEELLAALADALNKGREPGQ